MYVPVGNEGACLPPNGNHLTLERQDVFIDGSKCCSHNRV